MTIRPDDPDGMSRLNDSNGLNDPDRLDDLNGPDNQNDSGEPKGPSMPDDQNMLDDIEGFFKHDRAGRVQQPRHVRQTRQLGRDGRA